MEIRTVPSFINAVLDGMLAVGSTLLAVTLSFLWKRKGFGPRWATLPLAFAFFTFGLLHASQLAAIPYPPLPLKALAAAACLASGMLLLRLLLERHAAPPLGQGQGEGEARQKHQEALGLLAGGLVHDFNNLLGAMAGNVELAQLETGRGGVVQPYLKTLEGLVDRSAKLVQQILAQPEGPLLSPQPEVPLEPASFEEALGSYRGTGTILVVEDEEPLRATAVKALQFVGFSTLEARDGMEALQVFETHQARINLVLLDLTMPRLDGEETYRVLRRSGVLVPVILSSGFSKVDVLQHFRGKGIAGFLQKPYRLQTLLSGIRKALEEGGEPGAQREALAWSKDLETGHPVMDQQHRLLLQAFNQLLESVQDKDPPDKQVARFFALREAALAHFALEDSFMRGVAFPQRKQHQAVHVALICQVNDLAEKLHAGRLTFSPPVMDFLEGWLVHHMQEENMDLGRFLRVQGH